MIIVAISGKMGSGKSTLAKRIESYYKERGHKDVYSLRFAQPLYEMHDLVREVLKNYYFDTYDFTKKDGNLLQVLGTEWGRQHLAPNVWVQLLMNKIRQLPAHSIITVEDCRFENEFDALAGLGALTVRLEASRDLRKGRVSMWRDNENHASETSLDAYAKLGEFDLLLNTGELYEDEVARQVLVQINQRLQRSDVQA